MRFKNKEQYRDFYSLFYIDFPDTIEILKDKVITLLNENPPENIPGKFKDVSNAVGCSYVTAGNYYYLKFGFKMAVSLELEPGLEFRCGWARTYRDYYKYTLTEITNDKSFDIQLNDLVNDVYKSFYDKFKIYLKNVEIVRNLYVQEGKGV